MSRHGSKPKGSKVELTLHSIHGVVFKASDRAPYPPAIKAAIAFGGSSTDMQVSSFTMCGQTGNLVVESKMMEVDSSAVKTDADTEYPLFASFDDPPIEGKKSPQSASTVSTHSSGSSSRPHLKVRLCHENPNVPSPSENKVNEESPSGPAGTEPGSPLDNTSVRSQRSQEGQEQDTADGAVAPDIVEFHISLRKEEDNSIVDEGVAQLVFFGNQKDVRSTTIDLKIQKKSPSNPNAPSEVTLEPQFSFDPEAYIRVQVDIDRPPMPSGEGFVLSENVDEKNIGNIEGCEEEELAEAREKAGNLKLSDDEKQKRNLFCNGASEFRQTFLWVFDAFRRCNVKPPRKDQGNIVRINSTMETTIATRESLLI